VLLWYFGPYAAFEMGRYTIPELLFAPVFHTGTCQYILYPFQYFLRDIRVSLLRNIPALANFHFEHWPYGIMCMTMCVCSIVQSVVKTLYWLSYFAAPPPPRVGIVSRPWQRIFPLASVQISSEVHSASYPFPARLGRNSDRSSPSSVVVKNEYELYLFFPLAPVLW
jgi:hypothetical protein